MDDSKSSELAMPGGVAVGEGRGSETPCVLCSQRMAKTQLEAHISAEHLDYFPCSCGHCGHHLPSADLAHVHAQRRAHFPLKIREFPNTSKEQELKSILQRSFTAVGHPIPPIKPLNKDKHLNRDLDWAVPEGKGSGSIQRNPSDERQSPFPILGTDKALESVSAVQLEDLCRTKVQTVDGNSLDLFDFDSNDGSKASSKEESRESKAQAALNESTESVGNIFSKLTKSRTGMESLNDKEVKQPSSSPSNPAVKLAQKLEKADERPSAEVTPKKCNICLQDVIEKNVQTHIDNHIEMRPMAGCDYCNFKGKSSASVRTHISRRHYSRSGKKMGIRDLSQSGSTYGSMHKLCFGEKEQDATFQDPALVSKHLKICRPYARRSTKSLGPKPLSFSPLRERDSLSDELGCTKSPKGNSLPAAKGSKVCSQKPKKNCSGCQESVTETWVMRHVWKHLYLEGKPKFECRGKGCGFQAYLLRTLDIHCIQVHEASGAAEVEFLDHEKDLKADFDAMWAACLQGKNSKIETHVWYAHLGGILPYRCLRCQESFITMDQVEAHWSLSHSSQHSPTTSEEQLKVTENPNAGERFNQMITACFPDLVEIATQ